MSESEFIFNDKRRIDPETFELRGLEETSPPGLESPVAEAEEVLKVSVESTEDVEGAVQDDADVELTKEDQLEALVAERTEDLQRLQAEYQNYKRRVDRDRNLSRKAGIEAVVMDLMPVLDAVEAAKVHGEINPGFKLIIDELERIATKYQLEFFGAIGDVFDPVLHEALMQMPYSEPVEVATVSQVMQAGIKLGDRVLRPARVAVADPE